MTDNFTEGEFHRPIACIERASTSEWVGLYELEDESFVLKYSTSTEFNTEDITSVVPADSELTENQIVQQMVEWANS